MLLYLGLELEHYTFLSNYNCDMVTKFRETHTRVEACILPLASHYLSLIILVVAFEVADKACLSATSAASRILSVVWKIRKRHHTFEGRE
jgi:hypothetical protein